MAAATSYAFTDATEVRYTLVHPAHTVVGTSHRIDGKVAVADGAIALPFKLSLPLSSFDSGNANRDDNALIALRATRYAAAVLEVRSISYEWKTSKPGSMGPRLDFKGTATGTLSLRGVTRPLSFPIEGWAMPADARVTARFPVSLAEFAIPAPQLLFVPVKDRVDVEVEAVAHRTP